MAKKKKKVKNPFKKIAKGIRKVANSKLVKPALKKTLKVLKSAGLDKSV